MSERVEVLRLQRDDFRLLVARFAEHGNGHRRMAAALREAGARAPLERLQTLRRLERRFAVDLGALCHRVSRRDTDATHPLERAVLHYLAAWRAGPNGGDELWIRMDRLLEVRSLIDGGHLVGEPKAPPA